jgi:hypothetical protein
LLRSQKDVSDFCEKPPKTAWKEKKKLSVEEKSFLGVEKCDYTRFIIFMLKSDLFFQNLIMAQINFGLTLGAINLDLASKKYFY